MNQGIEINQTTGSKYLNQYIPITKTEVTSKPDAKHGLNSFPYVVQLNFLNTHSDSNTQPPMKLNGIRLMM
jgi:hypothetical protein